MRDLYSPDVATAAYLAPDNRADDTRPTRAEVDRDEHPGPHRPAEDAHRGTCGGCGLPVSAFAGHPGGHEGSCLWNGGPWHPSCRAKDQEGRLL